MDLKFKPGGEKSKSRKNQVNGKSPAKNIQSGRI
jgi:hypothetical protein